jgi:hypothetical protein
MVLLSFLSVVAGCAGLPKYRPELPDDIGDKGLIVGQVAGIGRLQDWSIYKDVLIGNRAKGKVVNGFIAIPLSPGEYSLDGLYSESYGGSYTSGNATYTTKNTITLPLHQKFTVRPKEVTNLGLLVLYPDPNDKEQKKFLRLYVDNTADMKYFLKTSYPLLAQKVRIDAMTLAPTELISANLLQQLRQELATNAAFASLGYATYVARDVGTLAEVEKDKAGKVSGAKLIDVPTVSNLRMVSPHYVKDRFAFLTTNNRLFFVRDGKAIEKRPPDGLRAPKIYALGTSDLVIVDDKFEIYNSANNGDRWQAYLGSMTKDTTSVRVAAGATGYYMYTETPPFLIYSLYGRVDFHPIELPANMKNLAFLNEKSVGLFAEHEIRMRGTDKSPFYVRPAGKTAWEMRFMPGNSCGYIRFLDNDGLNLSILCVGASGSKQQYVSKDGGMRWEKDLSSMIVR